MAKREELPPVHADSEDFVKQRGKRFDPETMGDLLVGEPAHEAVKVSREALIALRDEASVASRTAIDHGPEFDHLAPDRSGSNNKVEGPLASRLNPLGPLLRIERNDVFAFAEWAAGGGDLDSVRRPQIAVLPTPLRRAVGSLSARGLRSGEHVLALVIEIGPPVDEVEIGMRKFRPGHGARKLVE